jgi:hypothetical protein
MFLSFAGEQICLMLSRNDENRHQKAESFIQPWDGLTQNRKTQPWKWMLTEIDTFCS